MIILQKQGESVARDSISIMYVTLLLLLICTYVHDEQQTQHPQKAAVNRQYIHMQPWRRCRSSVHRRRYRTGGVHWGTFTYVSGGGEGAGNERNRSATLEANL